MMLEKIGGEKIRSAGMAGAGYEAHVRRHPAVDGFALHRALWTVGFPSPLLHAARGGVDVSAQRALAGLLFLFEAVEMIGEKALGHLNVNRSFGTLHHLFGAGMTRVHGRGCVVGIEAASLFANQLGIAREVRANEISIFRSPDRRV